MNGIIPRSFVNSVNNIAPDEEGNVTINFPVTSVNGLTGAVKVYCIYDQKTNLLSWIPGETDTYAYFARVSPTEVGNDKGTDSILYINKSSTPPKLHWTCRLKNEETWYGADIYDSKNPPPYPVTSVNGKTGAVYVNKITQNNNAGISGLVVDSGSDWSIWHSYNQQGTILGKFEFSCGDAINNVPKIYIIDPASKQFKVVLTNDRFNCSLSGTTLHINWANI